MEYGGTMRTCTVEGCDRKHKAKGLCNGHYRAKNLGLPLVPLVRRRALKNRKCDFPACGKPHVAKGYCAGHIGQMQMSVKLRPLKGCNNEVVIVGDTAQIIMYAKKGGEESGRVCIDLSDLAAVQGYRWYMTRGRHANYARGAKFGSPRDSIFMHRLLLGSPPKELLVDHFDGDGLNNRRDNISTVTPAENAQNRALDRNNTSGHRGVYWAKPKQKWWATVRRDSKLTCLGYYDDINEAAKVANAARQAEYANFQTRPTRTQT